MNQSQSPAFQALLARLAAAHGPGLLYTGMPHPQAGEHLDIRIGPAYDRTTLRRRALAWNRFLAGAAAQLAGLPGRPFLFAVTNPPMLPHLAWTYRKLRGARYGLLIWDIYPDHMVRMGWTRDDGALARLWRGLNRRAFLEAEVVITLGDRMVDALRAQLGADAARCRFEVISNWADTETLRPVASSENPFVREHGLGDKLTVLYSGNLGATHGLESLIEAADVLRDDPRFAFVVIGDGLGRDAMAAEVARRRLDNVRLLPLQPWDQLRWSLAAGDVAVVVQAPGSEHLSVPSKTYSSLAAGSALLALTSPRSDLADLVARCDAGAVARSPGEIATALRRFADEPALLARCREHARHAAVTAFSADATYRRFSDVLGPMIRGAR